MRTLVDLLIEKKKREEKFFENYLKWAGEIKKEAEKELREVKVFLFGSIIRGEARPGSDIDILIISPEVDSPRKKSKIRTGILKRIGLNSPFELHLVTPSEYEGWYRYFLQEKVEV